MEWTLEADEVSLCNIFLSHRHKLWVSGCGWLIFYHRHACGKTVPIHSTPNILLTCQALLVRREPKYVCLPSRDTVSSSFDV